MIIPAQDLRGFDVLRLDGSKITTVDTLAEAYRYGRPIDNILVRPSSVATAISRKGIQFYGSMLYPCIDQPDIALATLNRVAQKLHPSESYKAIDEARRVYKGRSDFVSSCDFFYEVPLSKQVFEPYQFNWKVLELASDIVHGLYIIEFFALNCFYVGRTTRGVRNRVEQHFRPATIKSWWEQILLPDDVSNVYVLQCQPGAGKFLEEDVISRIHPAHLLNTRPGGRYDASSTSIKTKEYKAHDYRIPDDKIPEHMLSQRGE